MKQKGFTLAELLAVITILGVIALIVFPAVNKAIKNSKEKSYNQQVESILESAENWTLENMSSLSDTNDNYIAIGELQQSGYLEAKKVINPITDEEMNGCIIIKYNNSYNQYTYQYNETSYNELKPKVFTFQEIMGNSSEVTAEDPDGNLRYVGADPDNYVWFNNELWRIIGLFDGQAKIIKNDFYDIGISWNDGSITRSSSDTPDNYWAVSSLQVKLNETYLPSIQTNDFTSYNYIDLDYVWNIGGIDHPSYYSWTREGLYNAERGDIPAGTIGALSTWQGAIGLMYPSDYGYSTSSESENCDLEMNSAEWENYPECYNNSWLYNGDNGQWTITSRSNCSDLVLCVSHFTNSIHSVFSNSMVPLDGLGEGAIGARPTLFLKPDVVIIDGTGSSEDPYILDMP